MHINRHLKGRHTGISALPLPPRVGWTAALQTCAVLTVCGCFCAPSLAQADLFHYNNVLVGTRAMGLGGAFTAMGDDASGTYYNPAGLAFSPTNDLSASVNSFYQRNTTYQNVFGQKAFQESARGSVSSFFGGLKRISWGPLFQDMAVGFALYSPDAGLSGENFLANNEPDAKVIRYHRTANLRTSSLYGGLSLAKRFFNTIGLGVSCNYFDIDELQQVYQDVRQGPFQFDEAPGSDTYLNLTNNDRYHLKASGIEPAVGLRIDFSSLLSLGISARKSFMWKQEFGIDNEVTAAVTDINNNVVRIAEAKNPNLQGTLMRTVVHNRSSQPFAGIPTEWRFGLGLHPGKSFLWTFDLSHRSSAYANVAALKRGAVVNYSTGVEVRPFQFLIVRAGAFTNLDATASHNVFSPNSRGEHMDYRGISGQLSLKFNSAEYSASYVHQSGKGVAQKVQGRKNNSKGDIKLIAISASQFL